MQQKATWVFRASLVLALGAVALCALFPVSFQTITKSVRNLISVHFGWYYLVFVAALVVFCLVLMLSPVGKIRLSGRSEEPEHSRISWIAMLFSAGMGIGLVFWGAAEPLSHYAISSPEAEAGTLDALRESFKYTFFHWGISAWAIYGVVGLALAYFMFRKKEKPLLSNTLKPILGKHVQKWPGKLVDTVATFATIAGVSTSLGLGAMQIDGGLNYLWGIPNTPSVQLAIIAIVTVMFIASAVSGLTRGIKFLSNVNVILVCFLMAAVIVIGPTTQIFDTLVNTTGNYLQDFIRMSLRTAPYSSEQHTWIENWTIFYWAWWIAWSPFVGVFIARISKGRTVREFLGCVILVPTAFSALWFSAFGTLSINAEMGGTDLTSLATEAVLFGTFAQYPAGGILSIASIVLIASFFVTSADSATIVIGMITEGGSETPRTRTKVVWGVILSVFAMILLVAGGLNALQNMLIIAALPFSIIMILMVISLSRELHHERVMMGLYIMPKVLPDPETPFRSYEKQNFEPPGPWTGAEEEAVSFKGSDNAIEEN